MTRVLVDALRNPALRRLELAFAAFNAAEWGVWIAMLVYAYARGGATTAGLVAFAQLVPASVFATVCAGAAARIPPKRILVASYLAQAVAMGATAAVLLARGPAILAYAGAAVAATAVTAIRPAQAAIAPTLARTPDELTAANVVSGWIESTSVLVAPAAAGVLIGLGGAGTVFAVMACASLAAAFAVAPLRAAAATSDEASSAVAALARVARSRPARSLTWLLGVEAMVIGALDVLYVAVAVGVLHHSGSVAGYLNAAFGAGGVAGVAVTASLVGRRRVARYVAAGLGLWSAALVVLAVAPGLAPALALLAAAGAGRTLVDVAGRTLLQRSVSPESIGEVFAVVEGVSMAGLAAGSLLASALVALAGGRGAVAAAGILLPLALLVVARGLLDADAHALPVVALGRLRAVPMFALLERPALETLARAAQTVAVGAGTAVIREGDAGELFYVLTSGAVEVDIGGTHVRTLHEGDVFGEIALLRDVPRTATCTARTDCTFLTLDRASFLAALGRGTTARSAADALAVAYV
ncbi:MAG TPA: cyclic nucleotide-binding domain-containing protein [Gaiellaceae bacterium]